MNRLSTIALIFPFFSLAVILGQSPATPVATPDQIAIYKAFLSDYKSGFDSPLYIASLTKTLATISPLSEDPCEKDFKAETQTATLHRIPASMLPSGISAHIVETDRNGLRISPKDSGNLTPSAVLAGPPNRPHVSDGVLTFSEVIFNLDHTRAVTSYTFFCGGLCGHGELMLFERQKEIWVRVPLRCREWFF